MGEISEMILDGELCEGCGAAIFSEPNGEPRRCRYCKRGDQLLRMHAPVKPGSPMTACKTCGRRVKLRGIADHMRDVHSAVQTQAKVASPLSHHA